MSRMNNVSTKLSTGPKKGSRKTLNNNSNLKQSRSVVSKGIVKRNSLNVNGSNPIQKQKGPKSTTGSKYDQGFECVSPPERNDDRIESFDELIGTLNGSVAFTTTPFSINPGLTSFVPWLSKIAVLFERYKFEELEFYFQHTVSQFNSQGASGLVLLSMLYDAVAPSPTNKTQVEATQPRAIGMPNQNILCKANIAKMHPQGVPLFTRYNTPANIDLKTYDAGILFASTQGQAAATEVGELHVRGRVRLIDRILDPSVQFPVSGGRITGSGVFTSANPLGNAATQDAQAVGLTVDALSNVTFANPGTYQVFFSFAGTVLTSIVFTPGVNMTSTVDNSFIANTAGTLANAGFIIVTTASNAVLAITSAATTITSSLLFVGQAPANSLS